MNTLLGGTPIHGIIFIRKIWPHDGSSKAGKSYGHVLAVVKIEDHRPCDGAIDEGTVWTLDDGSWEHPWNLEVVGIRTVKE